MVFGYTTAMVTEEYLETWGSNVMILSMLVLGVMLELGLIMFIMFSDEVEVVVDFKNIGD